MLCIACGHRSEVDAAYCSKCGRPIKGHPPKDAPRTERILPANTGGSLLPLNHPRVATKDDLIRPFSPAAFLAGVVCIAIIVGVLALGVAVARGRFAVPSWLSILRPPSTGAANANAAVPPQGSPVAVPSPTLAPTLQMTVNRLEQQGSDMVQVGEYTNNSLRIATNLTVTITFRDAEGNVVDVGRTTIRAILPRQRAAWTVRVPYRPGIVHADIGVNFSWSP